VSPRTHTPNHNAFILLSLSLSSYVAIAIYTHSFQLIIDDGREKGEISLHIFDNEGRKEIAARVFFSPFDGLTSITYTENTYKYRYMSKNEESAEENKHN
jgi:hypothetical protein